MRSATHKPPPPFTHVYVEQAAREHPETRRVLERMPQSRIVPISHHKEILNRPRQEWRAQKAAPALVLALRRGEFLYAASAHTPDFGHGRFHYNALAQNCLYDCAYCYLQGMFPSAHLVLFVNNEDYLAATDEALKAGPMYLALSYDTDLLALENILPYTRRWVDFARDRPSLSVEIRTKSAAYAPLGRIAPAPNAILAWTLSPDPVAKRYESKTPSLAQRLRAAAKAMEAGWPVRLCVDPVLLVQDWHRIYTQFVATVSSALDLAQARDVSIGVFRMNKDYLKNMRHRAAPTDLLYYPYTTTGNIVTYAQPEHEALTGHVRDLFSRHIPPERIFVQ